MTERTPFSSSPYGGGSSSAGEGQGGGSGQGHENEGYVRLVSKEGHNFYVERNCAMEARTLKAALTGGFQESKGGVVHLSDISTDVLERVIQYLHYKIKYNNSRVPPPEFPIDPEMALDLLMASNYLGC